MYIYYLDGADIYDYFTSDIEPIDHLEVNHEVKLYGKGIQDTSAASWSKIEIEIWNADKNEFEIVIVYINSDALSPYMREIKVPEVGGNGDIGDIGGSVQPPVQPVQPVDGDDGGQPAPSQDPAPAPADNGYYRDENGILRDEWGRPIEDDPGDYGGTGESGAEGHDFSGILGA